MAEVWGPWIQPPDELANVVGADVSTATAGRIGYYEENGDVTDPYPTTPYNLLPSMVVDALARDGELWPEGNLLVFDFGATTHGGTTAGVRFTETAVIAAHPTVTVGPQVTDGTNGEKGFFWFPFLPDGALDVEFEGDPRGIAQWLEVYLSTETTMGGDIYDDTDPLGPRVGHISGSFLTEITVAAIGTSGVLHSFTTDGTETGGGDWVLDPITGARRMPGIPVPGDPLGDPIDLTSYMSLPGDQVSLTMTNPTYVLPLHPPTDFSTSEGVHDGTWSYGYGWARLVLQWRLRPPRHRFLYERTPYRRTFPRDDALAGGAFRTYPPSKAMQSSNRTSGSYL